MKFCFRVLQLGILLSIVSIAFALPTPDQIGMSSDQSSSVQTVAFGGRVYLKVHFDSSLNSPASGHRWYGLSDFGSQNPLPAADQGYVGLEFFDGNDPATSNNADFFSVVFNATTIDSANRIISGYFDVPASGIINPASRSLCVSAALWYKEPNTVIGTQKSGPIVQGYFQSITGYTVINSTPASPYDNSYMTVTLPTSTAPGLIYPSSNFQAGHFDGSVRIDLKNTTASVSDGDSIDFIDNSSIVVQRIYLTGALAANTFYGGIFTYDPSRNTSLGGFSSVASDNDSTVVPTTLSFTEPTNAVLTTRAPFIDGHTYTVKLWHSESGSLPNSTSQTGLTYDISALTPSVLYPVSSFQSGRDNNTMKVRLTLPEKAKPSSLHLEFLSGGSVIQSMVFADTTAGNYSGILLYDPTALPTDGQFTLQAGAQFGGDASIGSPVSCTGTTTLVQASTYTVRTFYTDAVGNVSDSTAILANFGSFVYDTVTVAPTASSPANNANTLLTNETFSWNNSEAYASLVLHLDHTGGTADGNHALTVLAGSSKLNSGAQSITIDLSNMTNTADYTVSGGSTLVAGAIYSWYLTANDVVTGNTSATSDPARTLNAAPTSATPSLYEPSTYWQGGHNNNTIRVDFSATTAAPANNDTLSFIDGSSIVRQQIVFGAVAASTLYAGRLTYSAAANSGAGGFTGPAADADTTGATTFTFTEPTLGTRAVLVNGSTYTVKLSHCESGKLSASASYASFVYDNSVTAPTLGYPNATYQRGEDNSTITVQVTLPENAKANSLHLEFLTGGSPVQQLIFSNVSAGTYSGNLLYSSIGNGSFSVVAGSQIGADGLLTLNSETNTTGLIEDHSYTVRAYYTDAAGNTSTNSDFTTFNFDTASVASTLISPTSPINLALASQTFSWTNPEQDTSLALHIDWLSGTADAGSPHIMSDAVGGSTFLNTSGTKSLTIDLSSMGNTGDFTQSGGTSLVAGATYHWYITSNDVVTGNATATSTVRTFTISSGNVLTVTGVGIAGSFNGNPPQADRPVYKITASSSGGTATLNQLVANYTDPSNTAMTSDITAIKLWSSSSSSFNTGTATMLSSQSYNGNAETFSGFSANFTTTPSYLFITVSTSSTASNTRTLVTRILNATDFSFSTASSASGSFPLTMGSTALPVELNRFYGSAQNGRASLSWVTESEFNNAGFDVLRRVANQGDYEVIAAYNGTDPHQELRSQSENGTSSTPLHYSFTDRTVTPGTTYEYRLRSVDLDGIERDLTLMATVVVGEMPHDFALMQNYPNPFNNSTTIRFTVPVTSNMKVVVFDITGREVARLVNGSVDAGTYTVVWNGISSRGVSLSSGTYFVQMTSGKFSTTRKIALLK